MPNRINENKSLFRLIVMKLQNIKDKGTRAIRRKRHMTYGGRQLFSQ